MGKIKLRALTKADIDKTLQWHNREDIRKLYLGHPFPVNREMEETWYDKILYSNVPITVFGIELLSDEKLIGLTILKDINLINRAAELAIFIGDKDARGKGCALDATLQTLAFGFNDLGLERISLKVLVENSTAIKLYEKCGFIEEGRMRKFVFKDGVYKEAILMSILREEFYKG
jgi:diamine N-acetyltransferase